MHETSYDENTIQEFLKKYKWGIWVQQLFYVPIIVLLFFCKFIVPDWCDTFGFYDARKSFHYVFGVKNVVMNCVCFLAFVTMFYIIPLLSKAFLKDRYVEFMVAKHNGNLPVTKIRQTVISVIFAILVVLSIWGILNSLRSMGHIIVTDDGFSIQNNFTCKFTKYTFDYFDHNSPAYTGNDVAFGKSISYQNGGGWKRSFSIGKYSPYLKKLIDVLDEKTNGKYHLSGFLPNDIPFR